MIELNFIILIERDFRRKNCGTSNMKFSITLQVPIYPGSTAFHNQSVLIVTWYSEIKKEFITLYKIYDALSKQV